MMCKMKEVEINDEMSWTLVNEMRWKWLGKYVTDSTSLLNTLPQRESNDMQCQDAQEAPLNVSNYVIDRYAWDNEKWTTI